ncbi:MAG: hypothetical protein WAM60_14085 [Candidatus Promineifilaceae bacterium]
MKQVGVDCRFAIDGTIDVQRIYLDKQWIPVGQGRQWVDQGGRHVLIMLPENQPREICLRPDTMTWELRPIGGQTIHVV